MRLFGPLYDRVLAWAAHRHAPRYLGVLSFAESSFFPIPPDVMLAPMTLARPQAATRLALLTTVASVLGGLAGYYIGYGLFESVGRPVLEFYGKDAYFEEFSTKYNEWGAWAVLIAGVTPFPYKVITILSGVTGLNFVVFMVASVVARGLRFFIVAGLLWKFGPPIRDFIEKRLGLVFTVFMILLIGGFIAVRYL